MTIKSDIEGKIAELEPRIARLEECYERDIVAIHEILRKMEKKITGGGLDSDEIGLVAEVRDLKREMSDNKRQLQEIEKNVCDIKDGVNDTKQLTADVAALKLKIEKYEKYKWLILGGAMTIGWIIGNIGSIVGIVKTIF